MKGIDNVDNYCYTINNFVMKGADSMARIVIENVPEDVRASFKAICTVHNTTMRDELLEYITSRVKKEVKRTDEGIVVKLK